METVKNSIGCLCEGRMVIVLPLLVVALFQISFSGRAFAEDLRLVPQLGLKELESPIKVSFAPHDKDLLMGVNLSGRIDLFDIGNPRTPDKVAEIAAAALDAAFTPKGTPKNKMRIVSGGSDGTVRLWTLEGKPAAAPFVGHRGWVWSVAFSPDGTRIDPTKRIAASYSSIADM